MTWNTAMDISVAPVSPDDPATFQQLLAIYQEAIEPSEQKPADAIAALLRDKRYLVIVSRAGPEVMGFAIAFFPEEGNFWLLEYVAVAVHLRARGIGSRLFREILSAAQSRIGCHPCILEVDQAGAAVSIKNDPKRRLRFYARQSCRRLVGLNYILPLSLAGTPPPMHLLVHGLNGQHQVKKELVHVWLSTIYRQVYGCPPDDPRINIMLSPLTSEIEMKSLSMSD
jgi:GNAT superfamily N-acetyltransferase